MLKNTIDFRPIKHLFDKRCRGSRSRNRSYNITNTIDEEYFFIYINRYAVFDKIADKIGINKDKIKIKDFTEFDFSPIEIEDIINYPYEEGSDQLLEDRGAHPPSHIVPEDWFRTADPNEIDDIP